MFQQSKVPTYLYSEPQLQLFDCDILEPTSSIISLKVKIKAVHYSNHLHDYSVSQHGKSLSENLKYHIITIVTELNGWGRNSSWAREIPIARQTTNY
jgi:hypothetical protein